MGTTFNILTPYESNAVHTALTAPTGSLLNDNRISWRTVYENLRVGNSSRSLYRYIQYDMTGGLPRAIDLYIEATQTSRVELAKGGKGNKPPKPETKALSRVSSYLIGLDADENLVFDEPVVIEIPGRFPTHVSIDPAAVLELLQVALIPWMSHTGTAITTNNIATLMDGSVDVDI